VRFLDRDDMRGLGAVPDAPRPRLTAAMRE
jgi:hypothetical protein